MRLLSLFVICLLIFLSPSYGQNDFKTEPAGHFNTSRARMKWMGANYRKEWNTPIKVPVLNLATEKGGLRPVKKGGGKQTKSLRLEDASGRDYVIRSIQKFITEKTLPGDLHSEAAADLVSDGVSASYPFASLSMQPLADAAGVPYGKVKLVYVPDDPRLGEFRADFGNMLATFEERVPDNVKKVYDTDEVADKLEEDNDNKVDQKALLTARVLDMFVMDLDRHEGQWNWGATDNPNGKGKTYFAIPKDRDQAFYTNQGTLPRFVAGRSLVPQLEGFKAKARSISRFNFAARNLDRFFLNELTAEDWKSAAEKLVSQMTDAVIDKAMNMQPPEIRPISASKIGETLKARRNNLVAEVMEYYNFISETVSVTGSDKKEVFNINRSGDGSVSVTVYKVDKDGNKSTKMYERKFDPMITKEIRLYGLDGQDKFVLSGDNDKIKIRLIGGGGEDVFENPGSKQASAIVYDKADGGNKITGRFTNKMSGDSLVNSFDRLGYKYPFQSIFGTIGFNPDDGFLLGPTFKYIRHGFRKEPHKSLHQFKGLFAFSTKAVNISYNNEFIGALTDKTDLITEINYRGPFNTTNFFGYGVNSVYDKNIGTNNSIGNSKRFRYYRVRYDMGDVTFQIRQRFSPNFTLAFGPTFQFYHMDNDDKLNMDRNVGKNTVAIGLNPASLYVKQEYVGAKVTMTLDTRDDKVLPSTGINWVSTMTSLKAIDLFKDKGNVNGKPYDKVTQINSDFTFYLNLIPDRLTFVNRIGGGITLGDGFEFIHAQYLGTEDNLRGFRKYRFAGKSKFYNQAELRLRLANFQTYLFPAAFGILGFVDAGRVWVKDDQDEKFLSSFGGGFWFSPLRRLLLSISVGVSNEDVVPMFGMGWKF